MGFHIYDLDNMLSYSIVKLDPQCLVKKRRGNEYLALTISAILAFIGESGCRFI